MNQDNKDEIVQLYLDDIIPNRFQPREVFDEKALKELAVSIKEHGVIQPIIVRSVNGKYEIIAGERRYKASALAGLTKIPAIIRNLDDKESSKVALLENLQRKNLNPIEEARTYQKILEIDEMTQEELAKTMGKSQSAVANKIRLLSLPEEVQEALLKEQISERHARTLLHISDNNKQKELLKRIIDEKMSVRSLEEEIRNMTPKEEPKEPEVIDQAKDFINDNPIMPTVEMPVDNSNYGKVTIAPPEGEEKPKFINYGEIGKEEDESNDDLDIINSSTPLNVDLDELKATASDIKPPSGSSDLDSFLNIGNYSNDNNNSEFLTPAEKIVKTDPLAEDQTTSDYFQTPDLSNVELPTPVVVNETPEVSTPKQYTLDESVTKIKEVVEDIKAHGINIELDEMNFDKNLQMIIKIDKNNN